MSSAASARPAPHRLPIGPYPGLRPFQDREAGLLFGRERQSREVIERLGQRQFVALLGGSGSGKSSLVLASVLPQLRSFGLPGAGDFWVALSCTPGTPGTPAAPAPGRTTPLTRLARRFAGLLRSTGSDAADAQRQDDIALLLRQPGGLARLLDTHGSELALPPGPDPAEARVLFVLDQFEEVFHPGNRGLDDARWLVECVIDHFFNPHPRVYVALTMRSEYLNECAAFLELPDAINRSSYLVRRLDEAELREVIVGPAQRYLRLLARAADDTAALPHEVAFEPAVLERIVRDTQAISQDPDHLPLLQHLLARLWAAALERQALDIAVPALIGWSDLVCAAGARPADQPQALDEHANVLRASLENGAEALYQRHDEAGRAALDRLLARLGGKDPVSGQYTQQRLGLETAAARLGPGRGPDDVRALLAQGFLGGVDYLFWDDQDPRQVTIKVSHESFIRGWPRLRHLVDRAAERYDAFAEVVRRCEAWQAHGRDDGLLLEDGELRRFQDAGLLAGLAEAEERAGWLQLLRQGRDGPRLATAADAIDEFLARSDERTLRARRAQAQRRRNGMVLLTMVMLALPATMYSAFVQTPVTQRAAQIFAAVNEANRVPMEAEHAGVGAAAGPLAALLRAAELLESARVGGGSATAQVSVWLIERLAWFPPVERQGRFLRTALTQSEPAINGKLRALLGSALWHADAAASSPPAPAGLRDGKCLSLAGEWQPGTWRLALAADGRRRAALRVAAGPDAGGGAEQVLYAAAAEGPADACRLGARLAALPPGSWRQLLLDADLRYVAVGHAGPDGAPRVTLREIDWLRADDEGGPVVPSEVRAVVGGDAVVDAAGAPASPVLPTLVASRPAAGGHVLSVAGRDLRLVSPWAQLLADTARGDFATLPGAGEGGLCGRLARDLPAPPGPPHHIHETVTHCYVMTPLRAAALPGGAVDAQARLPVQVRVFDKPPAGTTLDAAPVVDVLRFARVGGPAQPWLLGRRGAHAGWLALDAGDARGATGLVGLPLSTCALWRLGRAIQHTNAAADDAASRARLNLPAAPAADLCMDR